MSFEQSLRENYIAVRRRLWGKMPASRPVVLVPLRVEPRPLPVPPTEHEYLLLASVEQVAEPMRWRVILAEVCHKHNITYSELVGDRRSKHLVKARHEAAFRLSRETEMSLPAIGRRLNRDHTTILYGLRCYQERIEAA